MSFEGAERTGKELNLSIRWESCNTPASASALALIQLFGGPTKEIKPKS